MLFNIFFFLHENIKEFIFAPILETQHNLFIPYRTNTYKDINMGLCEKSHIFADKCRS